MIREASSEPDKGSRARRELCQEPLTISLPFQRPQRIKTSTWLLNCRCQPGNRRRLALYYLAIRQRTCGAGRVGRCCCGDWLDRGGGGMALLSALKGKILKEKKERSDNDPVPARHAWQAQEEGTVSYQRAGTCGSDLRRVPAVISFNQRQRTARRASSANRASRGRRARFCGLRVAGALLALAVTGLALEAPGGIDFFRNLIMTPRQGSGPLPSMPTACTIVYSSM